MIDLTTYALLRKQITTAASGVSDVRAEGDELVFVLADGHEVRVAIPATEIRDAVVRDDVLVLTLENDKEVVVDTTLTQSGQAADAKATGDALSYKLNEPSEGLAVGRYFRIASLDESGHAVLEAVDAAQVGVQDVQVSGASIVTDGVADVPVAYSGNIGLVRCKSVYGIAERSQYAGIPSELGVLQITPANNDDIRARYTSFKPVTPYYLDYAVRAAMCDGKGAAWTSEEQAAARERIGFPGEWELIEETKITEEITQFKRTTEPNGNTYNFAAVVMRADFGEIPSDIVYNSAVYNVIYNEYDLYDYFTERKIPRDSSLWSYVDCSGKCPIFSSFTATNSGYSLVSGRTGFINSFGNNLKCRAVVINMVCASGLFPAGVKFTIWGVRA